MQVSPTSQASPGRRVDPHQRAQVGDRLLHGRPGSLRARAARRVWGLPDIGDPRSTTPFNEAHILAITQAICLYPYAAEHRRDRCSSAAIRHAACRKPAFASALEVLAANGVDVMVECGATDTRPPRSSRMPCLAYKTAAAARALARRYRHPRHRTTPPRFGGFKYDPPHRGSRGHATLTQ